MRASSLQRTLILLAALAVAGCTSRTDSSSVSANERAQYESDSQRRLAAAQAGIDSLRREAQVRADTARVRIAAQIDDLERRRQEAARELDTLKASGARRWQEIKLEMADMLANLEAGVDSARVRLKR